MVHALSHVLARYGYLAIFLLVMMEDFGLPTPGETALIAAAVAAASPSRHHAAGLNIWGVVAAGFLGAVIGDNIGYAIGHFGGRRLVLRVGGNVGMTDERLKHAEGFFHRFGDAIVVGARFVEILRQLNGIIAGTMGMHWATFLAYNALGAALWVGTWSAVGYFAGEHLPQIESWFLRFSWLALILIFVGILAYLLVSRHRVPAEGD
jgi:membrane protein DedA with SNARE-associated domain